MSVADWFTTFHTNLAITNGADISYRYKRITQRLNTDFWNTQSDTAHSIYVGSYGRDTAIGKISDLDMAFWLPNALYHQYNAHAGNGQSAFLQAVRTSIQQTYPTTSLGADGQVLTISFTDNVKFEILPCFENTDGSSFTYPDSNSGGSWKTSNPRAEITAIKNRNNATNGNLKRLCRMMRAWKDKWTVPMGGLLIDTLAYAFISTWESRDRSFRASRSAKLRWQRWRSPVMSSTPNGTMPSSLEGMLKRSSYSSECPVARDADFALRMEQ